MTDAEAVVILARQVRKAGGIRAWAEAHGIHAGRTSEVLNGIRRPNDAILAAIGLERRIVRKRKTQS